MDTLQDAIDGLHERFATVPGLARYNPAGELISIIDHEPSIELPTPFLFTLLDGFTSSTEGQITVIIYRFVHALCVLKHDAKYAEREIRPYIESIPQSVERDIKLGQRISQGAAWLDAGDRVYRRVGGVIFQAVDFRSTVMIKRGRKRPAGIG